MIIKRWNGSAFVEEHPKTKAQLIFNNSNTTSIFDTNDKIKPAYLPNSVFDSLTFQGTTTGNVGSAASRSLLAATLIMAKYAAEAAGRTLAGYYYVISTAGTISALTAIQEIGIDAPDPGDGEYATLRFRPTDGGSEGTTQTSSGALEVGDWFVIESVTGSGTSGSPWVFTASVINNTYENATTALDGIVRLSSQTTYASLSGNNVVTDGVLKTVIDNAGFSAGSHTHGDINNNGTITATAVTPGDTDYLLISDTSASGSIERGVLIGTGTTTYLRNDGTWGTPAGTYAHPTQTAINANATDDGINVIDSVTVNTLGHVTAVGTRNLSAATTTTPGHMTAADKSKLDGIAVGATANTGTVTSVATSGTVSGLTLTGGTITTSGTITLGGTLSVLPSNFASQTANHVLAAPNGSAGTPTFRALVAADIPTLNQNTTGTAANVTGVVAIANGGTGATSKSAAFDALSPMSASGDIIYGGISGTGTRLGKGTDGQVLKLVSGLPAWSSDADTIYSAGEGITLSSTTFRMTNPLYVQTATPTTSVTGTIWYDIN